MRWNKGQIRNHDRKPFAAHLGKQLSAGRRSAGSNIAHGDGSAEAYAESAGSNETNRRGIILRSEQPSAAAHQSASLRPQTHAPTRGTLGELLHNRIGAGKAANANSADASRFRNRPFQGGLDRRGRFIEIEAIKAKTCLEPQAVARAKCSRGDRRIAQQRLT